jgi:hypothetical protein
MQAAKGLHAYNACFTKHSKSCTKFKAANDGEYPCHGSVLGVLRAAGASDEEYDDISQQTAPEAYESVAKYLPNGCPVSDA